MVAACGGSAQPDACPPDSYLDYRNFGAPFLRSWCTGCHSSALSADARAGAPLGVDFDTYAGALAHLDAIKHRASVDMPTMPPRGPPRADERALLAEWIACGAP